MTNNFWTRFSTPSSSINLPLTVKNNQKININTVKNAERGKNGKKELLSLEHGQKLAIQKRPLQNELKQVFYQKTKKKTLKTKKILMKTTLKT